MAPDIDLTDGRIRLRPLGPGDEEAFFEAARESVAEVSRWLPWCHPGYSREEAAAWMAACAEAWANDAHYPFGIFEAGIGRLLGGADLNHLNRVHHFANLGYWVRTGAAGRGIATAAVRLTARFGFETLGLFRIEIVVDVGNEPSLRVAAKAGARREGILRNRLGCFARPNDAVMFSLIPDDFLVVEA